MEYHFKFTIDEYATTLKTSCKFNKRIKKIKKFLNRTIIFTYLLLCLTLLLNSKIFIYGNYVLFTGFLILIFSLANEKILDIYRLLIVKRRVKKNPFLLEQSLKIKNGTVSYIQNNTDLISRISDVSGILEHDGVIVLFNKSNNILGFIPESYFKNDYEKEEFVKQFYFYYL